MLLESSTEDEFGVGSIQRIKVGGYGNRILIGRGERRDVVLVMICDVLRVDNGDVEDCRIGGMGLDVITANLGEFLSIVRFR